MKLEQLHHFVAIVEHGSLRAAARRLGLQQPALTRSVRALERELGTELFTRSATGMALTPAGRRFHQRAATVVGEVRRARDELRQIQGTDDGEVSVALSIAPHAGMLPSALPAFRRRYPQVRVHLIEALFPEVEHALRSGTIDFYLGAAPRTVPAPGLQVTHCFDNQRVVVARAGHPLRAARSLRTLATASWATTALDHDAEGELSRLFEAHGLPAPQVRVNARTSMSIAAVISSTDLLAMLPVQWTRLAVVRAALISIPVKETLPAPPIVLIRRPDLPLTPAAEHFCDLLMRGAPTPGV